MVLVELLGIPWKRRGGSARAVAARGSDRASLRLMLYAGANPSATNREGRTPLHMSCQAAPPWRVAMAADLLAAWAPWWASCKAVGTAADEARARGDAPLAAAMDRMAAVMADGGSARAKPPGFGG